MKGRDFLIEQGERRRGLISDSEMQPADDHKAHSLNDRHVTLLKRISAALIILFCVAVTVVLLKAYFEGKFDSTESLRKYIEGYGIFAPVVLTLIQAAQVVIPVLPGFLGCAVGAVMFGSVGGFLCNYIGISGGSIIAFLLARRYGTAIVKGMFSEEKYEKWSNFAAKSKSYTVILFAGMVLPLFPDDFFCYFTGLTKMSVKKFVIIIVLGKPWCILAYSIFFAAVS